MTVSVSGSFGSSGNSPKVSGAFSWSSICMGAIISSSSKEKGLFSSVLITLVLKTILLVFLVSVGLSMITGSLSSSTTFSGTIISSWSTIKDFCIGLRDLGSSTFSSIFSSVPSGDMIIFR